MKRLLLLMLLSLLVIVGVNAASTKAYTQLVYAQGSVLPNHQFPDVTNTSSSTAPGYVVRAWITTRPTEVTSTDTHAASLIRLYRFGNGTTVPYDTRVFLQLSTFSTQWMMGEIVHIQIDHEFGGWPMTDSWEIAIPDGGGGAWTVNDPVTISLWDIGEPYTYSLNINGPAGISVTGPGAYAGVIPWQFICETNNNINDLVGDWTASPAPTGFHWAVNPITVTANDFVLSKVAYIYTATITFVLVANDTYTYNLSVNGPVGCPYTVTGPGTYFGTLNTTFTCGPNQTDINDLLGPWTVSPGPAGYHWEVNPIIVTAGDFVASKADHVYNATITFSGPPSIVAFYTLTINGPVGYSVTGPGNHSGIMNSEFEYIQYYFLPSNNDLLGNWTASAAPLGYHWMDNPIQVTPDMFNLSMFGRYEGVPKTEPPLDYVASIDFVLAEDENLPDIPGDTDTPVPGYADIIIHIAGGPANYVHNPVNEPGPRPNPGAEPSYFTTLHLLGEGPWTITYYTSAPVGMWYSYVSLKWIIVHNVSGTITFHIPAGGKDIPEVPIALGDETLPVELSSFAATLTASNFVNLNWVSESETNLLGYRAYRSENNSQACAISITPAMIPATNTSTTQSYNFMDEEVEIGYTYYYWLESIDMSTSTFYGPVSVLVQCETPPVLTEYTTMGNNHPNPFRANTSTTILVNIKAGETGKVTIYNLHGQVVKSFTVREGQQNLSWNSKDSEGNGCGSGIYFYKLSTPSVNITKKMVILK